MPSINPLDFYIDDIRMDDEIGSLSSQINAYTGTYSNTAPRTATQMIGEQANHDAMIRRWTDALAGLQANIIDDEITSLASDGVSAGVDFNISPWWTAGDYHHYPPVHNGDQVNISAQDINTMGSPSVSVSNGTYLTGVDQVGLRGNDISTVIIDDVDTSMRHHLHNAYDHTGMAGIDPNSYIDNYSVNIPTHNKCIFCDSIINDETYNIICDGCYTKLSDNIELLNEYIRNICESCTDAGLRLNMIGILLTHHKIIDSFNVSGNDIHIDFVYSYNGKRMVLINKIPDSPTDIVPREMFIID